MMNNAHIATGGESFGIHELLPLLREQKFQQFGQPLTGGQIHYDFPDISYRNEKIRFNTRARMRTIFDRDEFNKIRKKYRIIEEFKKEKSKLGRARVFEKDELKNAIETVIDKFLDDKFRVTLEVTYDKSVFFTALKDKFEIHIELFTECLGDQKEALFSIYKEDEMVLNGWDNVPGVMHSISIFFEQVDPELNISLVHALS